MHILWWIRALGLGMCCKKYVVSFQGVYQKRLQIGKGARRAGELETIHLRNGVHGAWMRTVRVLCTGYPCDVLWGWVYAETLALDRCASDGMGC